MRAGSIAWSTISHHCLVFFLGSPALGAAGGADGTDASEAAAMFLLWVFVGSHPKNRMMVGDQNRNMPLWGDGRWMESW